MGWVARETWAPDTFEDWRPFLLAARAARVEEVHWPLDPLDFRLIGHVARAKRGRLWVYGHVRTGCTLSVDEDGVPHRVRVDRAMRIRTKPIDIRPAVWGTGVPQEELERRPPPVFEDDWWPGDDEEVVPSSPGCRRPLLPE